MENSNFLFPPPSSQPQKKFPSSLKPKPIYEEKIIHRQTDLPIFHCRVLFILILCWLFLSDMPEIITLDPGQAQTWSAEIFCSGSVFKSPGWPGRLHHISVSSSTIVLRSCIQKKASYWTSRLHFSWWSSLQSLIVWPPYSQWAEKASYVLKVSTTGPLLTAQSLLIPLLFSLSNWFFNSQ